MNVLDNAGGGLGGRGDLRVDLRGMVGEDLRRGGEVGDHLRRVGVDLRDEYLQFIPLLKFSVDLL